VESPRGYLLPRAAPSDAPMGCPVLVTVRAASQASRSVFRYRTLRPARMKGNWYRPVQAHTLSVWGRTPMYSAASSRVKRRSFSVAVAMIVNPRVGRGNNVNAN